MQFGQNSVGTAHLCFPQSHLSAKSASTSSVVEVGCPLGPQLGQSHKTKPLHVVRLPYNTVPESHMLISQREPPEAVSPLLT